VPKLSRQQLQPDAGHEAALQEVPLQQVPQRRHEPGQHPHRRGEEDQVPVRTGDQCYDHYSITN
jgi:hypothetical protein